MNAVADTIGAILGKPVRESTSPPRPGDIRDSWADLTAAREVLGYEPAIGLEEGLRRTTRPSSSSAASRGRRPSTR